MDIAATLGIILIVMGLAEAAAALYFYVTGLRTEQWLQTQGRLIEAKVGEYRGSRGEMSYYPIVRYSYDAAGASYEGARVTPGRSARLGPLDSVRQKVDYYASQPYLTVYYDPAEPESSALEVGPSRMLVGVLGGMGAVEFVAGAALLMAAQAELIGG